MNKKSKQSFLKIIRDRKFIFYESITSKNKNNLYKFIDQYLENNPEDENELVIINTQAKTLTEVETMNKNNQGFNQTQLKQLADLFKQEVPPIVRVVIKEEVPPMIEAAVAPLRERMDKVENEIKEIKQDVSNMKQEIKEIKQDVANMKEEIKEIKQDIVNIKQDIKLIKSCPTIQKELASTKVS